MKHKIFRNDLEPNFYSLIESIHENVSWHSNMIRLSGDGETAFLPDTHWLAGLIFHYGAIANSEAFGAQMGAYYKLNLCFDPTQRAIS